MSAAVYRRYGPQVREIRVANGGRCSSMKLGGNAMELRVNPPGLAGKGNRTRWRADPLSR